MPSKSPILYPSQQKALSEFGERLRLARLRRRMSAETLAARASISRTTLARAEEGSKSVSIGTYIRILAVLHLLDDLTLVAQDERAKKAVQYLEFMKQIEMDK